MKAHKIVLHLKELSDNHVCDFCKCACANCDLLYLIFLFGATGRDLRVIKKKRHLISYSWYRASFDIGYV
jgi:hypothetical protein